MGKTATRAQPQPRSAANVGREIEAGAAGRSDDGQTHENE